MQKHPNTKHKLRIENEIAIHRLCKSKFVVQVYKCNESDITTYMFLEVCPYGDLYKLMKVLRYFDEERTKFYMACVFEAISFIHSKNVAYRDLKLENLVLTRNGYVKLTDFGISKVLTPGKLF